MAPIQSLSPTPAADELFIPPSAPPLTGDESFIRATYTFLKNPLEGFGPMAWNQPIVSIPAFGNVTHVISDPGGIDTVLVTKAANFTKAPIDHRILSPATKEGLLSVHGDQWKRQRKTVAPIFRPRFIEQLAPMVREVVDGFIDGVGKEAEVELNTAMAELTFDVLAKALLGDPKGLDGERLKFATRNVVTSAGTLRPDDLLPLPRWVPRPMAPKGALALRKLKAAADDLIAARDPDNPGDDLVGLLIGAGDRNGDLSPREQRDNLIGFFIAGHETTALTLTWALYLLGRHRPTAERVRAEVEALAGDSPITYAMTRELPFTQAVIDETMRLYPPAPLMNRECHVATDVCERTIEPGHVVVINNYIMHRAERLWDNPNAFDPDRFLRDPTLKAKGAPFKPFGAGPRICVGAAFATMESVMALASLIRAFDIHIADDVYPKPIMTVTLRPQGGVPARLVRR